MRHVPVLPTFRSDAVTRQLCSAVHLDEAFARSVHRELAADRMKGMGPPLGVNLMALVRHACEAVKRRDKRDTGLAWLSVGLWLSAGVALSGVVRGSDVQSAAGACALVLALGAAWWLVHRAEGEARKAAVTVFYGSEPPMDLAPPAPREVEDRIRELKRPNMVAYAEGSDRANPFVGSGSKIKEVVWQPIDVSRPADAPGGGKMTIVPFDAVDLHTYVAREMANVAGLEGLRSQNRLYVRGMHVRYLGDEVLPDPLGHPRAQIPRPLVKAGLLRPGAGMRTYLSLERVGEGGRVIVSMHLRARLHQPSLSWEVAAYAIPPVDSCYSTVQYLPKDGFERWWSLVRFANTRTWRALTGSLGRIRRRNAAHNARARELEKWRKDISKRNALHDYGAEGSLREQVGSWDQLGHSERMDSQDFLHRLQNGVLIATERFLKAHHVDTSSFDQAQQVISTQTYNISGDITGPSNFGNNGQATANYGSGGGGRQPGGGGGAGGGAP